MSCGTNCNRLCVCGFGLAAGTVWGLGVFLLGLVNIWCEWGRAWVEMLSHGYVGYEATFLGAIIGFGWAFVDGLVAGLIFALVYNCVCRCCGKMCKICCSGKDKVES